MGHWYKTVLYYLWIAPHGLLVLVAVLMYSKRQHKNFPIFFLYALYETLSFVLRFSAYTAGGSLAGLYRHVYIATAVGSIALRFGIIQEIFNNVFREYPRLVGIATASMRWITGLLVVAVVVLAFYSSAGVSDDLLAGIMLLDQSIAIIQAGLLLFLFLFSRMFGLSWRSFTFGVALGFGIFASTELAYWALRLTDLTERSKDLLDLLPTGSYHVSVVVWLGYLLAAEKSVGAATYPIAEMDEWSGELERHPR